jgi:hypothetical protein
MTSPALTTWQLSRLPRLDRLIALHPDSAGSTTDPAVAEEWTHALVLRLTSEFQGFCRDLHNDLARTIARALTGWDEKARSLVFAGLTRGRALEQYSANAETIRADFDRLGVDLLLLLSTHPRAGPQWTKELKLLHMARNGVVHDDPGKIEQVKKDGRELNFRTVDRWRNWVDGLVDAMDDVTSSRMSELFGMVRWKEDSNGADRTMYGAP